MASNEKRFFIFGLQPRNHTTWEEQFSSTSDSVIIVLKYGSASSPILLSIYYLAHLPLITTYTKSSQPNVKWYRGTPFW